MRPSASFTNGQQAPGAYSPVGGAMPPGAYGTNYPRSSTFHQGMANCCGGQGGAAGQQLQYVGAGRGQYGMEQQIKYVGYGGDYDYPRRKHCSGMLAPFLCCLALALLLPCLYWWLCSEPTPEDAFDCNADFRIWEAAWSMEKREYCCEEKGRGCKRPVRPIYRVPTTMTTTAATITTTPATTSTPPPAAAAAPAEAPAAERPVDPYNCAIGQEAQWIQDKKEWCCQNHYLGCPPNPAAAAATVVQAAFVAAPPPADPYNCAEGFPNWKMGWSDSKKKWCCDVHHRGCPGDDTTTPKTFDCDAGFANWMNGWSIAKKQWCCDNFGKGCVAAPGGC